MKTVEEAARKYAGCPKGKGCGHECKYFHEEWVFPCERYASYCAGVEFAQYWVSVKDKLPKQGVVCVVKRVVGKDVGYAIGIYNVESHLFQDLYNVYQNTIICEITHWRPIEIE